VELKKNFGERYNKLVKIVEVKLKRIEKGLRTIE